MRLASNSASFCLVFAVLWSEHATSSTKKDASPEPKVTEERTFDRPEITAGDVLAAPFYIPRRFAKLILFPLGRATGWALDKAVPDRVVDFFTDTTGRIRFLPYLTYTSSDGLYLGGLFEYANLFYQKRSFRASGAIALNLDRRASASFTKSASYNEPIFYRIGVSYSRDTDADFYGAGINSSREDKSIYTRRQAGFSVRIGWQFRKLRFLSISGIYGLLHTKTASAPNPGSKNPVEATFDSGTLTGFGESLTWIKFGAALKFDSRIPSGHPHRGGVFSSTIVRFQDVAGRFGHFVYHARASTIIDVYRKINVLVFSARYKGVFGEEIPFFRLQTASSLRGFSRKRFLDRQTLVGSVDYRFRLWTSIRPNPAFIIGNLFVDLGKPFHDWQSFATGGVKYSVGAGITYTTRNEFLASARLSYGGEEIETKIFIGSLF